MLAGDDRPLQADVVRFRWLFRSRAALEAEILVLRHQLNVLHRKSPGRLAFSRRVRRDANDMVDTLCCQRDTDFVGQDADDLTSWHVRIEKWR
jgi:hypothetical protein